MPIVGSQTEDEIELGAEFTRFGIRNRCKLDHEVLRRISHPLEQTIFGIPRITVDETLGCEDTLVLEVNSDMNVRSARPIGHGLDRPKIIAAIPRRHEAAKSLEVGIALRPLETAILGVNVGPLVIDLPDFDTGIRNRVSFHIGHRAMKVRDGPDGRGDLIIDSDEIIVGIKGKLIGIKWPLGHGGRDCQSLGKSSGDGEQSSGTKNGTTEKVTTVTLQTS